MHVHRKKGVGKRVEKWRRRRRRRGKQGEKIFSPSREHACARAREEGSGETSREVEEEERKTGEKIFSPSREHACARAQEEGSGEMSREVEEEESAREEACLSSRNGNCFHHGR